MNHPFLNRLVWASLLILSCPLPGAVKGLQRVAVIRVAFQPDASPGTTGDGSFLLAVGVTPCGEYTVDPPPHDKDYFWSQLKAVDHYFRSVSYDQFGLDLNHSRIFPADALSAYELDHPMNYYHPLGREGDFDRLVTELFKESVDLALKDQVDLSTFDQVVVVHAGVGQDFNLPFLDPTPEDIPSTYIDETMLKTYLGGPIPLGNGFLKQGIVLPETQNHLFYNETLFSELESPCDAQFGLTGTFALMLGFAAGLPPLWEVESGRSGIGIFGLMDQGSSNGRGLVPAPPDAWTRIFAGWEEPVVVSSDSYLTLPGRRQNTIIKIPINQQEYFLVENRVNWFRQGVGIDSIRYQRWVETGVYPPFVEMLIDSTTVSRDPNGVITGIPNYDYGLPASGLLIWHIDESRIEAGIGHYAVNPRPDLKGVDLEEADGAQDLGFVSRLIPDPSSGYFGDMWFKGNREYERANPHLKGSAPEFGPYTFPDTRSNSGAASLIHLQNISEPADPMSLDLTFDRSITRIQQPHRSIQFPYDLDGDGTLELFGSGDSLWWSHDSIEEMKTFYPNSWSDLQLCISPGTGNGSSFASLVAVGSRNDSLEVVWFDYDDGIGNFKTVWRRNLADTCGIGFVQAESEPPTVTIRWAGQTLIVRQDSVEYLVYEVDQVCDPLPKTVDVKGYDALQVVLSSGQIHIPGGRSRDQAFLDLALIDLDRDGNPDILAVDEAGTLYAFDQYLQLKSGFPVDLDARPPVLARDLLGTDFPEIVLQNRKAELLILDWQGRVVSRFTDWTSGELKALGRFAGHSSVLTSKTIYQFKTLTTESNNAWNLPDGGPDHGRSIQLTPPAGTPDQKQLIDWSKTYVYPNPSYGEPVLFRIQVINAAKIRIRIFDIAGFAVKSLSLDTPWPNAVNEISWEVEGVQPGVYLGEVEALKGKRKEAKTLKIGVIR